MARLSELGRRSPTIGMTHRPVPELVACRNVIIQCGSRERRRGSGIPVRLFRFLVQLWLNDLGRRLQRSCEKLDRADLLHGTGSAGAFRSSAHKRPVENPLDSAAAIR
jgi:hypothetical protein